MDPDGIYGSGGGFGCGSKSVSPEIIRNLAGLTTRPACPEFPLPKLLCIASAFLIIIFSNCFVDLCEGYPCVLSAS